MKDLICSDRSSMAFGRLRRAPARRLLTGAIRATRWRHDVGALLRTMPDLPTLAGAGDQGFRGAYTWNAISRAGRHAAADRRQAE